MVKEDKREEKKADGVQLTLFDEDKGLQSYEDILVTKEQQIQTTKFFGGQRIIGVIRAAMTRLKSVPLAPGKLKTP